MSTRIANSGRVDTTPLGHQPSPSLVTGNFEWEFREEVAHLVESILRWCDTDGRAKILIEARDRGVRVERIVAEGIALEVMKKVDDEYL